MDNSKDAKDGVATNVVAINDVARHDVTANSAIQNGDDGVMATYKQQQYKWYNVNWNVVPTKLSYFFECGRGMGFAPNLVLFLISIGLNKEESGFIVGLR